MKRSESREKRETRYNDRLQGTVEERFPRSMSTTSGLNRSRSLIQNCLHQIEKSILFLEHESDFCLSDIVLKLLKSVPYKNGALSFQ